jgi:quercetin dioxygenase-like cupin family protein
MKLHHSFLALPVLAVLTCVVLFEEPAAAQYARRSAEPLQDEWENNWMRLSRVTADPGAAIPGSDLDRILIYLTADADGRIPPAEAVWQPAGSGNLENRGRSRVEAIAIELKDVPAGVARGTPPEALTVSREADVRHLIDNPRVLVTRNRYAPAPYMDRLHFHPEDILIVYLRGGYTWPAVAGWGSYRVRRGEVDIVPANTFHRFGNAGGDPLEFLVIIPR